MPKYLFQASYTQEGLRGLMDEGLRGVGKWPNI